MKRIVLFLLCVAAAVAQPTQTTITDTLYNPASNALLEGTIRIELMTGGATSNQAHVFGERTLTITSGALSLTLPPNSTMSPSGSYYRVTKSLRPAGTSERYRVSTVTWTVPTSATCSGGVCRVADIESITAPTPSGTINISRLTSSCAENQTFVWNGFNFACSNVLGANPMEAVGDMLYGNSSGVLRRLAGNTTTTRKYLLSVGNGSTANIPAWTQPAASDLSNGTTGSGNVVLATSPTITSATISGSLTGNASTATALAANGSNCSAGQFPLGVDASGAAESCTALPTTIAGTANQITASASTGAVTLSLPSTITGLTSVTSTSFVGALTGNASTATALATNPADCSANQYATTIAANGDLTCAQPAASNLSNGTTGTGSIVLASSPTIVTPTIASFANATHSHQNSAGGGTLAGASALSDYSTAFVTSITGTANQVIRSASVGGVTLSLPQDIHTAATPTFGGLTSPSLTNAGTLALSATGANVITLSTNGSERARVSSAGNVLVGTTTDDGASRLQVNGIIRTTQGTTSEDKLVVFDGGGGSRYGLGIDTTDLVIFASTNAGVTFRKDSNSGTSLARLASTGTFTLYNQTAPTGSTSLVVRAGAGQSTNNLVELQNNAGTWISRIASSILEFKQTTFTFGVLASTEDVAFELGSGRTGNGSTYIDLKGDATYTDYGLRILRSGGANADSYIQTRGTGTLYLSTADAGSIILGVAANTRFKADNTGIGFFGVTPVARAAALTAANNGTLNTGDATSDSIISTMRTRIAELESKLQAYGLLN